MQKILQSTFISSIYSVKRKLENIIFKTFVQVRVFSGLSFFIGGVRRRLFHNVATARKLPLSLTTLCQMQNLRQ